MPVCITPGVARLLTSQGREAALAQAGMPEAMAKLAALLSPDPTVPYSFASLKLLDLPMRRAAVLARARMKQTLSDLGLPDPDLLWAFLERHPRTVEVGSVTHIPKPPGVPGRVFGEIRFPQPPSLASPCRWRSVAAPPIGLGRWPTNWRRQRPASPADSTNGSPA